MIKRKIGEMYREVEIVGIHVSNWFFKQKEKN
jgi:hypothetical protein